MSGGEFSATDLNLAQRRDWLRLIRSENVGPATFRLLINRYGSAASALAALPHIALRGGGKAPTIPVLEDIERELEALYRYGGRLVAVGESDYPPLMRHIHGPPPLLAVMGAGATLTREAVGIVGARNASAAGMTLTKRLAADIGEAGFAIVSGLARGIDAAAHSASLKTGTIAVLAGGLDNIYPEDNRPLAEDILANSGVLITEMPFGYEPRGRDFPRRNRLISGIARGVVVVEAAKRSGSLITARFALEQNREVFAVPGSPMDPRAEGVNALIRDGATLTRDAIDVIEQLRTQRPETLLEDTGGDEPDYTDFAATAEASEDDRTRLAEMLSVTPVSVDDLIVQSGLAAGLVQTILLELEIAGRVRRSSGQLVYLSG
ncbi:MAG: DNA-processing protein DprA [Cucumibacter sp.]